MSRDMENFGEPIAPVQHEVKRDHSSLSAGGIFLAILGVIGSISAWYIMAPVLILVLSLALILGWSPRQTLLKTMTITGMVAALIAVIGLAIFAFLFAVCLINPRAF